MDLQTRKLQFIEEILSISDDEIIDRLESVLREGHEELNPILKQKLTTSALKANEDIKAGRLFTREEADKILQERMGI